MRLETTASHSIVGSALTVRMGDVVSGGLDWSRRTRLGGLQLQRNFALQPERVTFPIPAFYGQANLPSTVDLYVDGLKQYSSEVPAGPFQLHTVPMVNGSGQAEVVLTDGLGRQSTVAFPFYTTDQLLREGLSDFSIEAGAVRQRYGMESFSYGDDPAASAVYRYGLNNRITLAGHAESMPRLVKAGAGAMVALGQAGVVSASFAASRDRGVNGQQAGLGYNWRNRRFNLSLNVQHTFGEYRDIAARYSLAPPERSERALLGFTLGRHGSLGVSYVALKYPEQPRSRYGSAYYSKSFQHGVSMSVSVNQNLDDHRERSVFVGLSVPLGRRVSSSTSVRHQRDSHVVTVDVHKPIQGHQGAGWRVRAQEGDGQRGGLAEAGCRGQHAEVRAGVQNLEDYTQGYAEMNGAVVLMNRQLFAARHINDGFAVVSTEGVAKVPVLLENRPMGSTNKKGNVLVTPLNAYQRNKLSIDPMALPSNVSIDRVEAEAVPADRAGTVVEFGIRTVHAASIIVHNNVAEPLPVGSLVRLRNSNEPAAMVGYDGMVYLEGLGADNVLEVQTPEGLCVVSFHYQPEEGTIPLLGPLMCQKEQP